MTKTGAQCKNFYFNYKKKLRLEDLIAEYDKTKVIILIFCYTLLTLSKNKILIAKLSNKNADVPSIMNGNRKFGV